MITKKLLWVGSAAAAVVLGITIVLIVVSGGTNRDSGSATNAQPSQSGQASTTTTTASEDSSLASQLVRSKSVGFSTGQTDAAQDPSLTLNKVWVQPGDPLEIGATNLAPFSTIHLEIHSEVIDLGDVIADDSGSASTDVTIPASLVNDPGIHMIVANGIDASGQPFETREQIRVGFDSSAPWIDAYGSLGAISFSANNVDVTAGTGIVTMTSNVHDDLSGFQSGSSQWRGPNDTIFSCIATRISLFGGGVCTLTSGDDLNGSYSSPLVFPATSEPGSYRFASLSLTDHAGNSVHYFNPAEAPGWVNSGPDYVDITTLGYAPESFDIRVTSNAERDTSAPSIDSFGAPGAFALSTTSVDTSVSDQTVTMTLDVHDDRSGFDQGGALWSNGTRTVSTCIARLVGLWGGGYCTRTFGDALNGSYSSPIRFPAFGQSGVYRFMELTLDDPYGNRVTYFDPANTQSGGPGWIDITTLGYTSGSFDISSTGTADINAPTVQPFGSVGAITLSRNSVNTSTGSQTVTMSLSVSDDLSGFEWGSIQWRNDDLTLFSCVSERLNLWGGGACTRVSGNEFSGTYSSPLRFPANGRPGTYHFVSLDLTDKSGNTVRYFNPAEAPGWVNSGPDYVDITTLGYAPGAFDIVNGP